MEAVEEMPCLGLTGNVDTDKPQDSPKKTTDHLDGLSVVLRAKISVTLPDEIWSHGDQWHRFRYDIISFATEADTWDNISRQTYPHAPQLNYLYLIELGYAIDHLH